VVREATQARTPEGLVPEGDGWYVVNAREARWRERAPLGRSCLLEAEPIPTLFRGLGFRLAVLDPGQPSGMYHGESEQEDFLVVAGECVLLIEGEERRLRQWDFVHCPPWTEHVFVGAGDSPCAIVMVGARNPGAGLQILYPVSQVADRHGASVEADTRDPREAYARFVHRIGRYREGDLPEDAAT
jgi:uncharacterized cupin superfamily protein